MLATRVKAFQAAGSRPQVRGASVIVAARPTKATDFKGLDNAELLQKVSELKREHLRLEYMQRTRGNTINPGAVSRSIGGGIQLVDVLRNGLKHQCTSSMAGLARLVAAATAAAMTRTARPSVFD